VGDEPKSNDYADCKKNGQNSEPVLSRPPKGHEEEDADYNGCDLASNDIEAGEDQSSADERLRTRGQTSTMTGVEEVGYRSEIACW